MEAVVRKSEQYVKPRVFKRTYLKNAKDAWYIESLFGVKISYTFLDNRLVENLFKNADFSFYKNKEKTHLFSQNTALLEHDFGKLEPISALDALKLYGLETLEKAKEKVYVKTHSIELISKLIKFF